MRRSDFSSGIEPSSLPPQALPLPDQRRSLGARMNDFSPPPPPLHLSRMDIGRRVGQHAYPDRDALRGFTFVRGCDSPRASTPHALTGWETAVNRQPLPRAVAFGFWLPPLGPMRDFHPRSFIHAQRTSIAAAQSDGDAPAGRQTPAGAPSNAAPSLVQRDKGTKAKGTGVTVPGDADMIPNPHRRCRPNPSPTSMARARQSNLRDENRRCSSESTW